MPFFVFVFKFNFTIVKEKLFLNAKAFENLAGKICLKREFFLAKRKMLWEYPNLYLYRN